jgi:hypothetical protein
MKRGLEGRLRKMEEAYAEVLEPPHVVSIRWLTADEIKRGRRPGLYRLPRKDGASLVVPPELIPEDAAKSFGSDVPPNPDEKA